MKFSLSGINNIHGKQLAYEILQATGIDVIERYIFYPPNIVEINGLDIEQYSDSIQSIISEHIPDPLYFEEDRQRIEDNLLQESGKANFRNLPNWASWTPDEGKDFIHESVFNGQSSEDIQAYIDANPISKQMD